MLYMNLMAKISFISSSSSAIIKIAELEDEIKDIKAQLNQQNIQII